jgi:hypothetical protein
MRFYTNVHKAYRGIDLHARAMTFVSSIEIVRSCSIGRCQPRPRSFCRSWLPIARMGLFARPLEPVH